MDAKPGDMIHFKQEDGRVLTIICGTTGVAVAVKAENPGTKLDLRRDSDFCFAATAVDRGTSYYVEEGVSSWRVTSGPFGTLHQAQCKVPRGNRARVVHRRDDGVWIGTVFEWSAESRRWVLA